jgi:hypothetical protein
MILKTTDVYACNGELSSFNSVVYNLVQLLLSSDLTSTCQSDV